MKTKLEIVSGFLGAGKTSFINAYLKTMICIEKDILIILLENGISLIRRDLDNIKVIYLEKVESLKETLFKEINKKEYSRVLIEFNGTSDLRVIGEILRDKEVRKRINFYGSYYIGDGKNLRTYLKNLGEIIIPFIQSSKLIILNNISLISENEKKEIIRYIDSINPTAPIFLSKDLEKLEHEMKLSKYFKEGTSIKILKALLYKKEIVR